MKNVFKFFVPMAAAVIATLASCVKEDINKAPEANVLNITVEAIPEEIQGEPQAVSQVKTYINGNAILWGTGEYMKIGVNDGSETTFANSADGSADTFNGQAVAQFNFSVSVSGSDFTYYGLYPASAAVASNNTNPAGYKVNLPSVQNATATSYDPKAYILVAQPESGKSVANNNINWQASFRRATALNKITLKNVPSGVSFKRVKITAPTGTYLAGGRHIDLTRGLSGDIYNGGGRTETIEVKYATPLSGTNVDVWFTSWNMELGEGDKLTVVAYTTDKKSYTREITIPSGRSIKFLEGNLNTTGVSLSGISPADVTEMEEGDYLILAKNGDTYYAMKAEDAGSSRIVSVDYDGSLVSYNGDADMVWTIEASGSSFTVKNGTNYLGWTSGNSALLLDEADYTDAKCLMDITYNGGTYQMSVNNESSRILAKNNPNPYFAFYTGSGYNTLVFVPATVDPRAAVTLSFAEESLGYDTSDYGDCDGQTATASPNVSAITSNISYAITSDDDDVISSLNTSSGAVSLTGNTGTATITASFAGDETYRAASASYTIIVSSPSGPRYEEVSSLSNVTAGEYIIVNNNTYLPNASTSSAPSAPAITISSGIVQNPTSAMTWTFTGSASEMTIRSTVSGTPYLYAINNNNGIRVGNTEDTWEIAVNGDGFSLKSKTRNRYCATTSNNNGDWRSYNSATSQYYLDGGQVYLYKLDNSGVTPKVATPTFSLGESGHDVSIACTTDGATIYYTVDGSNPSTSSNVYSAAIDISSAQQKSIKAFATKSGYEDSDMASTTYYAINRTATTHGTVSAVDYAAEGAEITLTITPDSGYALETLSVVDGSNNTVTVSNNKFTMPAGPVTVSATFDLIPVTTVADALGAPGTYEVPNVAVYAVKGNALILGDATGKIYAFKSSHGLSVGDVRTVNGSTIWYNSGDVYEFDSPTFSGSGTTTVNHGTAVEFADNAATLQTETGFVSTGSGAAHSAVYVHAIGDQSGRNITTSNGKVLYLSAAESATDGKTVEVYGYVYAYSASHTNFNFLATSIEEYVDPNAKVITALKSSITGVSADGVTNASESGVYSLTNASDSDVTVTPDGTVVTAASISGGALTYTVAANSSSARSGSVTLAVAGGNSISVSISQLAGAGNTTSTEEITSGTFSGDSNSISLTTSSGITITQLKGDGTNCNTTYNTVSTLRVYRANQMSFTGKTFTKIEMYYTGSYSGASWSVVAGGGTVTLDTTNKKVVWTNSSGASTVTLQNSTSSGTNTQLRTTKFYFEF